LMTITNASSRLEVGMPVDRRAGFVFAAGCDVVAPITRRRRLRENSGVDHILLEAALGSRPRRAARFMWPGIAAGDGWIAYLTSTRAPRGLRSSRTACWARDRHAVAGHDHDQASRRRAGPRRPRGARRAHAPGVLAGPVAPSITPPPPKPPAMIAGIERFIATCHQVGQDRSRAPTISPRRSAPGC